MHNVGATQALGKRLEDLRKQLSDLAREDLLQLYNQLKGELSALSNATAESARTVSDKVAELNLKFMEEQRKIAELEVERARRQEESARLEKAKEDAIAERAKYEIERERAKGEEDRKTLEHHLELENKATAEREARALKLKELELAAEAKARREGRVEEDALVRAREQDMLKAKEEAAVRQEEERRKTELLVTQERNKGLLEAERAKAKIEAEAKIAQERQNEDVAMRKLKASNDAELQKALEVTKTALAGIGDGLVSFLSDYERLRTAVASIVAISAGYFCARQGAIFLKTALEKFLYAEPSLVRETSRKNLLWHILGGVWAAIVSICFRGRSDPFGDVVLPKKLEEKIRRMAKATANAKKNRAPLRHALFYGPAGTGKTMVAKRLAYHSGLDFAIMSGADVAPLGSRAVTEIHDIFAWAKTSSKGLILLIDEADAFLASRGKANMSEDLRNALNAILFHTGTQSHKFMLVLATNRPGDLDAALTNRIDETQEFALPGLAERQCLVFLYFARYISGDVAVRERETRAAQEAVARKRSAPSGAKEESKGKGRRRRQQKQQRGAARRKKSPAARNQQDSVGSGESDESETEERDVGGAGVDDSDQYSSNDNSEVEEDDDQGRVDNVAAMKARANESVNAEPGTLKRLVEVGSRASTNKGKISLDGIDCTDLLMIARDIRGFSGRDIAKLMVSIQASVYGSETLSLSREALVEVARERIAQFKTKAWLKRNRVGW